MPPIRLLKNNIDLWTADEETILTDFVHSDMFGRRMDEKAKLALFISLGEPRGLNSTILSGREFNRLWDVYTMKKGELITTSS